MENVESCGISATRSIVFFIKFILSFNDVIVMRSEYSKYSKDEWCRFKARKVTVKQLLKCYGNFNFAQQLY